MQASTRVHIGFTTHWDREWIQTFEQYRFRLVNLFDSALDILEAEKEITFFFDGQTVVLEDYLEVRPDQRERVHRLAAAGRMVFGPFYVLPEHFQEGPEATIRNILVGFSIAREFGGPMKEAYVPDCFGLPASFPAIMNGVGIDTCNFDRGRPQLTDDKARLYVWGWKDGSRLLTGHVGYANGLFLTYPDIWQDIEALSMNPAAAADTMTQALDHDPQRTKGEAVYYSAGVDHMELRPGVSRVLAALRNRLPHCDFVSSTPERYLHDVKAHLDGGVASLQYCEGEMRGDKTHDLIVYGVLTTNHEVKKRNRACETLLESVLEPFNAVYAVRTGGSMNHHIRYCWKELLKNHPHDSISACSRDEVIVDILKRFQTVETVATMAGERMYHRLFAPAPLRMAASPRISLFNSLPNRGRSPFEAVVRVPMQLKSPCFSMVDSQGECVGTATALAAKNIDLESFYQVNQDLPRLLSKNPAPDRDPRQVYTVLRVKGVADFGDPSGFHSYGLVPVRTSPESAFVFDGNRLRGDCIEVAVGDDGSMTLTDRASGAAYGPFGWYEDDADIGDTYASVRLPHDTPIKPDGPPCIRKGPSDPHSASLVISNRILIPAHSGKDGRKGLPLEHAFDTVVTLHKGMKRVDVNFVMNNRSIHHRMRAGFLFPRCRKVVAGSHFAVLDRPWAEADDRCMQRPFLDYIDVETDTGHVGVAAPGMYEFEPRQEGEGGSVLVTLFRSVSAIGSAAGCNYPIEHAKELRQIQCAFTILLTDSASDTAAKTDAVRVPVLAEGYLLPEAGEDGGNLPSSILAIDNRRVLFSCMKRAENGRGTIVRFFNPGGHDEKVTLAYSLPFGQASLVNLAEEHIAPLETVDGTVTLTAGPYRIMSVCFE